MPGFVHTERVRFGDLDALRHLDNAVLLRSAQRATPLPGELVATLESELGGAPA